MNKILLAIFGLVLLWPVLALTQTTDLAKRTVQVNGSEHPELIPDDKAAVAVFTLHSAFTKHTAHAIDRVKLTGQDRAAYEQVLHQLKTDRDQAYEMHGKLKVLKDKDFKTKASAPYLLGKLKNTMSAEGYKKLTDFISQEKGLMTYSYIPKEGQ